MKDLNLIGVDLKDIKTNKITSLEIEQMAKISGSYEALFSRRAMKFKALDLANKTLTEDDYKKYILSEYTFLKRPVLVIDDQIAIGNSKKSIEEMQNILG
jgi:arsenate reductase (glutaredoxin)